MFQFLNPHHAIYRGGVRIFHVLRFSGPNGGCTILWPVRPSDIMATQIPRAFGNWTGASWPGGENGTPSWKSKQLFNIETEMESFGTKAPRTYVKLRRLILEQFVWFYNLGLCIYTYGICLATPWGLFAFPRGIKELQLYASVEKSGNIISDL